MPVWGRYARFGIGSSLVALVLAATSPAATPPAELRAENANPRPTPNRLEADADAATRAGNWETAFSLYCRLLLTDRTPATRGKVSAALRRAQQARRFRDPSFRQFVDKLALSEALNLYAEVFGKLPGLFAERDRATPEQLWQHGIEEFDRALASSGFRAGYLEGASLERVNAFRTSLRVFWAKRPVTSAKEARVQLRHLTAAAVETFPVRIPAAIAVEFLCGACAGLDDYTLFLTPVSSVGPVPDSLLSDLQPYGLYLSFRDGGLLVDGVVPNSWVTFNPAAPIRKGDRIVRINGRSFAPGTPAVLAEALHNPPNGMHELELAGSLPDAGNSIHLPVVVPTVYGIDVKDGVGYARIAAFRESTVRELDEALLSLKAQGMRSLILDLRGNHGGLFDSGVQVSQRFLPAGIIATTQGQVGEFANRVFSSDSGLMAWNVPLVLLVDGETASAAEVMAGAMKDNNRATLVGLPTFGKGTIQFPFKLAALDELDDRGRTRSRSGTVRVTIARLLSPRGVPITGVGVIPHFPETEPQRQLELAIERAMELLPTGLQPMP